MFKKKSTFCCINIKSSHFSIVLSSNSSRKIYFTSKISPVKIKCIFNIIYNSILQFFSFLQVEIRIETQILNSGSIIHKTNFSSALFLCWNIHCTPDWPFNRFTIIVLKINEISTIFLRNLFNIIYQILIYSHQY